MWVTYTLCKWFPTNFVQPGPQTAENSRWHGGVTLYACYTKSYCDADSPVAPEEDRRVTRATFRIQSVAEMTGVNPVTLRAWERRYGVPRPVRTQSSYRLYSDADVDQVRRMLELCESGLAASEAARVVREAGPTAKEPTTLAPDVFAAVADELLGAARGMNTEALDRCLARALTLGSATQIYDRIVAPVMVQLGEAWSRGEISIAHEHVASEHFARTLGQLHQITRPGAHRATALLACFPEELHTMPLYGLAFRLAEWGVRAEILGARTPPVGLAEAVKATSPSLVALSVTLAPQGAVAREIVQGYALACGTTPWLVGGAGTAELAALVEEQGGHALSGDTRSLHDELEHVLTRRRKNRTNKPRQVDSVKERE